tara:strand:+ start:41255 stop:41845 length:591 start_codon:yes stop_codon:yes gene_type:complete
MDKNGFFSSNVQEIHATLDGTVTQSSNSIVEIEVGENIYLIHPFFESLKEVVNNGNHSNLAFPCVHLQLNETEVICDITIKLEPGFLAILLFDYSTHYENLHEAAQEKKTAMLNEQAYELNTKYSEEKKAYIEYIRDRIDHKIIAEMGKVVKQVNEMKKTELTPRQRSILDSIESNIGDLHLKAIQIKEGLGINLD